MPPVPPNWKPGGYLDRLPKDPWGQPYQYLNPGLRGEIDVYSFGADGQPGGTGNDADIGSWVTVIRTPAPTRSRARAYGFTLIELLVVLVIIGLAAGLVVLNIGRDEHRTAEREAKRLAGALEHAAASAQWRGGDARRVGRWRKLSFLAPRRGRSLERDRRR